MKFHLERRRAICVHQLQSIVFGALFMPATKTPHSMARDGPQFHDQWMELVEYSTVRRIIGVWDDDCCRHLGRTFYHNHINNAVQWTSLRLLKSQT